jgi:hypothetical protein
MDQGKRPLEYGSLRTSRREETDDERPRKDKGQLGQALEGCTNRDSLEGGHGRILLLNVRN